VFRLTRLIVVELLTQITEFNLESILSCRNFKFFLSKLLTKLENFRYNDISGYHSV